eukprot:tig00001130_g7235.t1
MAEDVAGLQEYGRTVVPGELNKLRACLGCSLVKTFDQFIKFGCPNCVDLMLQDDKQRVNDCTSVAFDGVISMMKPTESWVARWQRIAKCQPGVYAIRVHGDLPEYIQDSLDSRRSRRR